MNISDGIQLHSVDFAYSDAIPSLCEVTLSIRPGEFVGIVGANGSGKTTLARLLNGSLFPTTGSVFVDGLLAEPQHRLAIKRRVALIASDPSTQLVTSTVWDELAFSLQALRLASDEIAARCEEALDGFNLRAYHNIHPSYLSVGEQFRVLVAANLMRPVKYLVLDEVTSMLDSRSRHEMLERLMERQANEGVGLILLTHRLDDLIAADRIIVLSEGTCVVDDNVERVFAQVLAHPEWHIELPLLYQLRQRIPYGHEWYQVVGLGATPVAQGTSSHV